MSKAPTKASQFLAAMKQSEVPEYEAPPAPLSESIEEAAAPQTAVVRELPRPKPPKVKLPTRAGLKHFGGYLDDDTLEKIALLRMDADWYDSTKCILDNLGDRVVPGGIVIVDDYYAWEGCAVAVNEFAAARKWRIQQSRYGGVCFVQV